VKLGFTPAFMPVSSEVATLAVARISSHVGMLGTKLKKYVYLSYFASNCNIERQSTLP
jgi:hypothetical protein